MKHLPIALASVSLLALSAPAFAQATSDVPAADTRASFDTTQTAEIIVTARRKDESLQDVPLTVNAVTNEEINKLNIKRFEDLATVVPGLVLTPAPNGIGAVASVRGVAYDGSVDVTLPPQNHI